LRIGNSPSGGSHRHDFAFSYGLGIANWGLAKETAVLTIELACSEGNFTMEAYQDGVKADRYASDYKKTPIQVNRTTKVKLPLASGGGWAARIHP
jgi:Glycosyl-hydrolase 97 C-terminal, oligomerisation